jgi:HipA-like protein
MESGRTSPLLVRCAHDDGTAIEVVVKFSAFCDQLEENLAMEAVAACLAGDLNLPIPEPFLVAVRDDWIEIVADEARKKRIRQSSRVAFGSRLVTGGYSVWTPDTRISDAMVDTAAAIFAFDAIAQNPDRRSGNPNCLVRGENIRIIDHELAFGHGVVIDWRPPWAPGGLKWLERKGAHIFRAGLRRAAVNFAAIKASWLNIDGNRLTAYKAALPPEWASAAKRVQSALSLVRSAQGNIDACLAEIRRVLS